MGLNGAMKMHFWDRKELKRCVDRRIDSAMKLYCEHHGMKGEDDPNLQKWISHQ